MKITCPKCSYGGNLPDHEIPEAGRFVNCPHCRQGFTVRKPPASRATHLVDTCPACNFSTFGEERFGSCPKCGVEIKAFVERQREEQQRNQELLTKNFNRSDELPPSGSEAVPVADFLENLHPVNLIGWGAGLAAIIIVGIGLWGVNEYDGQEILTRLSEQRDEQVSGWYVFLHYGMMHWITILYGLLLLGVSVLFINRRRVSLKALSWLIWSAIAYVPVSHIVSFIYWVLAPIPHSLGGYLIEIFNIVFMSALVGTPLFLLERYLHNRTVTTVVRL